MNALTRTAVTLALLLSVGIASEARAQQGSQKVSEKQQQVSQKQQQSPKQRISPQQQICPWQQLSPRQQLVPERRARAPRLGYRYRVIRGCGFLVVRVWAGTPAAHIGLEVGDVVLSINGYPLTYLGADVPARIQAARGDGWLTLAIQDVRTGRVMYRTTNLFDPCRGNGQEGDGLNSPL